MGKFKALLLGCGNIGAMYDLENEEILTHAKAYALDPSFSFDVFDIDIELATRIAARYNAGVLTNFAEGDLSGYDFVSICTPTQTHFEYLKSALQCNVKVVLCEKPVSLSITELEDLQKEYSTSKSKVVVNYMRRFQPAYVELKRTIQSLLQRETLRAVQIQYQRGFINNCSHAFDLIQYLFGSRLQLINQTTLHQVADHFPEDPTRSFFAQWGGCQIMVLGLSDVKFSHFEIDIYFDHHRICIYDGGRSIKVYWSEPGVRYLTPLKCREEFTRQACLHNYMKNVMDHAVQLAENGAELEDNFIDSVTLNKNMLSYLN